MSPTNDESHLLALDIGAKRVGVAIASTVTFLPQPLITLDNSEEFIKKLEKLIENNRVETLVVGIPRNLSGGNSAQTKRIEDFIAILKKHLRVKIVTQDEALSSVRAEEELRARGKIFNRADIDKLAACLILEDYINR